MSDELIMLKAQEVEIRQRVDAAQVILREHWAELREVKAKIRAIEHPPRRMNERGLKPDDDLSFMWATGRTRWPKDKEARHAEKWRRERISDALGNAAWEAKKRGIVAYCDYDNNEPYEAYEARLHEFYRNTPIAELIRLDRVSRGLDG